MGNEHNISTGQIGHNKMHPVSTLLRKNFLLKQRSPIFSLLVFVIPIALLALSLYKTPGPEGLVVVPTHVEQVELMPRYVVSRFGHCATIAGVEFSSRGITCTAERPAGSKTPTLEFTAERSVESKHIGTSDVLLATKLDFPNGPELSVFVSEVSGPTQFTMGVALMLMIISMPCGFFIRELLTERDSGMTELLKIHGVKQWHLHFSWFLTYGTELLVQAICSTGLYALFFSKESPVYVVLPVIFLVNMNSVALCLVARSLVKGPRMGNAVQNCMLLFLALFPLFSQPTASVPIELLKGLVPQYGALQVLDEMLRLGSSAFSSKRAICGFVMLMVDLTIFNFLYIYLDAVMPRELGARKPWYFPFLACVRRKPKIPDVLREESADQSIRESTTIREEQLIRESRVVAVQKLTKLFGSVRAVDGISVTLFPSEVLCLLGANAAGKSTLTSLLLGMFEPTSGSGNVFGLDLERDIDEIRKLTGYCPQHDILWPEFTPREHLEIFASLRGSSAAAAMSLLADGGFAEHRGVRVKALSGGMKRKLGALIAFSGDSKLVILDEPTTGLDPVSRRALWEMVNSLKASRVVCLTTHFIEEASMLGDRVAIMDHGQLKAIGSPLFLKSAFDCKAVVSVDKGKLSVTGGKLEDVFIKVAGGEKPVEFEAIESGNPSFFSNLLSVVFMRFWMAVRRPVFVLSLLIFSILGMWFAVSSPEVVRKLSTSRPIFTSGPPQIPLWLVDNPGCPADVLAGVTSKKIAWVGDATVALTERWRALIDVNEGEFAAVSVTRCGEKAELSVLVRVFGDKDALTWSVLNTVMRQLTGRAERDGSLELREVKKSDTNVEIAVIFRPMLIFFFAVLVCINIGVFGFATESSKKFFYQAGVGKAPYWLGSVLFDSLFCLLLVCSWLVLFAATSYVPPFNLAVLLWTSMVGIVTINYAISLVLKGLTGFTTTSIILNLTLGNHIGVVVISLIEDQSVLAKVLRYFPLPSVNIFVAFAEWELQSLKKRPVSAGIPLYIRTLMVCGVIIACLLLVIMVDKLKFKRKKFTPRAKSDLEEAARLASVEFVKVTKTFAGKTAVDDVTLDLIQGEGLTLLGPNSAGKTTLTRLGLGEIEPTGGVVHVREADVGCCPQFDFFVEDLTVGDHLKIFAVAKGVKNVGSAVSGLSRMLGIEEFRAREANKLSGGNKRKLTLAIGLLGASRLLFLDEPSSGMDPLSQRFLWKVLRALTESGNSVLLTTHSMEEAEAVSSRIAIMLDGRIRCQGTLEELRAQFGQGYEITLAVTEPTEEIQSLLLADCHLLVGDSTQEQVPVDWAKQFCQTRSLDVLGLVGGSLPESGTMSAKELVALVAEAEGVTSIVRSLAGVQTLDISGLKAKCFLADETAVEQIFETLQDLKRSRRVNEFSLNPLSLEQIFNRLVKEAISKPTSKK